MSNTSPHTYFTRIVSAVERLSGLQLELIEDALERVGQRPPINAPQILLAYNLGENEATVGEIQSRWHQQKSEVSHDMNRLVENKYVEKIQCEIDPKSQHCRLTRKGQDLVQLIETVFEQNTNSMLSMGHASLADLEVAALQLSRIERFWSDQIRYSY